MVINDEWLDVSGLFADFNEAFFENDGLQRLQELVKKDQGTLPILSKDQRMGSPVARPSKIICIGLNYADHARETGAAIPTEPIIFFKSTTALSGPYDAIMLPCDSKKTDWEVELAVVVGKKASYVEEQEAAACIAGY